MYFVVSHVHGDRPLRSWQHTEFTAHSAASSLSNDNLVAPRPTTKFQASTHDLPSSNCKALVKDGLSRSCGVQISP